jgi:uncharacterized protein YdhG (YjbR/CyaY superfamily)
MNSGISNIDTYLSSQPENVRKILEKLRQTIKKAVPEAEEVFSYQMPGFRFHGVLVWYASFINHYSIFVRPKILQVFKGELQNYKLAKSAIRFPLDEPVQVQLVTKIVKYAAKENLADAKQKAVANKSKHKKKA